MSRSVLNGEVGRDTKSGQLMCYKPGQLNSLPTAYAEQSPFQSDLRRPSDIIFFSGLKDSP